MNKKLFFSTLGMCAFLAPSAMASDAKIYSGTSCEANPASLYYANGWAKNTSSVSTLTVDCAIARDNGFGAAITMYLIDRHYTNDVSCYASSIVIGTEWSGWWTAVYSTSGSSTTPQAVNLGTIPGNSVSWLHLTCTVPPTYSGNASGIQSYIVTET